MPGLRREIVQLRHELATLKRREAQARAAVERFDEELRLFGRIQRDLFPAGVPRVPSLEIQTLFKPAGRVGGDLFDVVRLDETRIGITLLDATGHGLAAALLSTLAGRLIRGLMANQDSLQALEPTEVLSRINRELLACPLTDCHFVAALCAVYDERAQTICWARGGAPYPILIRNGDCPVQIRSQGPLAGVDEKAHFEAVEVRMRPGDRILFYTDGIELLQFDRESAQACGGLQRTGWFRRLGVLTNHEVLSELRQRVDVMHAEDEEADDVTVVALKRLEDAADRNDGLFTQSAPACAATC